MNLQEKYKEEVKKRNEKDTKWHRAYESIAGKVLDESEIRRDKK